MSKKIAGGADVIIFDVKSGKGAFMSGEEAKKLAEELVAIGEMAGKKVSAEITPMDQPLGYAVGRALEVREAIEVLKGNGPEDVKDVCLSLAGLAFWKVGISTSRKEGKRKAEELLQSGKALEKFAQWMEAQGANPRIIDDFSLLPSADSKPFFSDKRGLVKEIDCKRLGEISHTLDVHPGGGIVLRKKLGDEVEEGDELALLFGEEPNLSEALEKMKSVFLIE
jgi:thymidine phosphorylase